MPDYVFTDQDSVPTTSIERWEANIEAIRIAKDLETSNRPATPAEQRVLARYSGFGDSSFEQGFQLHSYDRSWKQRGDELRGLVTPEEYESMERSRTNAFYTSPEVVKGMWEGLRKMGADQLDGVVPERCGPSPGHPPVTPWHPRAPGKSGCQGRRDIGPSGCRSSG